MFFFRSGDYPTQSSSNFQATVSPAIAVSVPYECAVVGGQMVVNSAINVSSTLNNNTLRYSVNGGSTWKTVTFPKGTYQTLNIQTQLQTTMLAKRGTTP